MRILAIALLFTATILGVERGGEQECDGQDAHGGILIALVAAPKEGNKPSKSTPRQKPPGVETRRRAARRRASRECGRDAWRGTRTPHGAFDINVMRM